MTLSECYEEMGADLHEVLRVGGGDADARRLIDFASGLSLGLYGRIERVTSKVFLLSPENVAISGDGTLAPADPESAPFTQ
mgnify:CR=1 FL=1